MTKFDEIRSHLTDELMKNDGKSRKKKYASKYLVKKKDAQLRID